MSLENSLLLITIDTNIFEDLLDPRDAETDLNCKNKILCHLSTKTENKHINQLLKIFIKEKRKICIDPHNKIIEEYKYRLKERIKTISEETNEIEILQYWLGIWLNLSSSDDPHYCQSDFKINQNLDNALSKIIVGKSKTKDRSNKKNPEKEELRRKRKGEETQGRDCVFIHIAAFNKCDLITNDCEHIHKIEQQARKSRDKKRLKNNERSSYVPNSSNINRVKTIKDAIKANLKHEETDIITSIEAYNKYVP